MKLKTIRNNKAISEETITKEVYQVIRRTLTNDKSITIIDRYISPCGNLVIYYNDNGEKIRLIFEF